MKALTQSETKTLSDLENIVIECLKTKVNWGLMQNDLMFALTYWSMLECGFSPKIQTEIKKRSKNRSYLPKDWKHDTRNIYKSEFTLHPYKNHTVKLIALPIDDVLCINAIASNMSSRCVNLWSLAVNSSGYVPRPDDTKITSKFSGLENFHNRLLNELIWPIRSSILTDEGILNGSLIGLSDEIKLKIISYLPVKELLNLSLTCHDLNRICNDQGLWKSIFHRIYKTECKCSNPKTKTCDEVQDWKENYKQIFIAKQMNKESERSSSESFHTPQETLFGEFDID